jgi:P-type Mg2+ transporter
VFFAALVGMVVGYLVLVEAGKRIFYRTARLTPPARRHFDPRRQLRRRAARFSTAFGRGATPFRTRRDSLSLIP